MLEFHYLPQNMIDIYEKAVLNMKDCVSVDEMKVHATLMGLRIVSKDEAKKIAKKGDCLLVEYKDKYIPYQIIHVDEVNNTLTLQSFYLIENRPFDSTTNVWRDCELRRYLNSDYEKNFNKDFTDAWIPTDVHTDNYVTVDKCWILSHEEVGYDDKYEWFTPNVGASAY